jgi:hypothetical protein
VEGQKFGGFWIVEKGLEVLFTPPKVMVWEEGLAEYLNQ